MPSHLCPHEKVPELFPFRSANDDGPADSRVSGDDLPSDNNDGEGKMLAGGIPADGRGESDRGTTVNGCIDDRQEPHIGPGALLDPCEGEREAAQEEIVPIGVRPTRWKTILLLCGKCARKMDGGYGPNGKHTLRSVLRMELSATGLRRQVRIIETRCMGICPRKAVTALNAAKPEAILTVPRKTPPEAVLPLLLSDGNRGREPELE